MPMGLVVSESIGAVFREAKNVSNKFLGGSIVMCIGSGMSIAGVSIALSSKVKTIYGISVGMSTERQRKRIKKVSGFNLSKNVKFILPKGMNYYERDDVKTPFPSSPYYDKKAWSWLLKNLNQLPKPVLFWNIGV